MKYIYSLIVFVLLTLFVLTKPQAAFAETAATSAALIPTFALENNDDINHIVILRTYLESRNSPLAPYAKNFVDEAKKNNLDWRLVAAISGLESSFGVHIPADSYNGWGFGIYGNNVKRFESWDAGIATVSESLRNDYMNKWNAQNVTEIGRIYAASPTWAVRVEGFMDSIDEFAQDQTRTTLVLSL
jgi:hypothetical protein